jgi:hypothetical protein
LFEIESGILLTAGLMNHVGHIGGHIWATNDRIAADNKVTAGPSSALLTERTLPPPPSGGSPPRISDKDEVTWPVVIDLAVPGRSGLVAHDRGVPDDQIGLAQADCCRFAARGRRFAGGQSRTGPLTWGGAEGI